MNPMPNGGRIGAQPINDYGVSPRYSGIWTPEDVAYRPTLSAWPAGNSDVPYAHVKMHLHFEGVDQSCGAYNHSGKGDVRPLFYGGAYCAHLSAAQSKFGRTSLRTYGTSSGIVFASHADYTLGTSDFTIRLYFRPTALSDNYVLVDAGSASTWELYLKAYTGRPVWHAAGGSRITSTTDLSVDTWYLVEVARVSGVTRMFVDGVQTGSDYTDSNNYGASAIGIGTTSAAQYGLPGYIDEFQLIVGTGAHSAGYTAPTAPFADQ